MYLLGGLTAGGITHDFWVLNLTTLQWRQEKVSICSTPALSPKPGLGMMTVVALASFATRGNNDLLGF
jgi:hypothetical protein